MSGQQKKTAEIMKHEGDSCWRNTLEKLTEKTNEAENQKSRNYRENDATKISYNTEKSA